MGLIHGNLEVVGLHMKDNLKMALLMAKGI
jgi:hypothetical protein